MTATSQTGRRIIRIEAESIAASTGPYQRIADADVVISKSGWVLKDRDGVAGRLATAQELAVAVRP